MNIHNYWAWMAIGFSSLSLILIFRGPLKRWYRKVRRRKGGVYLWRTDHHINRARRVNAYVGESVNFHLRSRDHMGVGNFGQARQSWSDLRPKMYRVIRLPWWLCWKWVLRPLETLVIFLTWPRYNSAKNKWNPLRILKSEAEIHRRRRDEGTARTVVRTWTAHLLRYTLQGFGACLIIAGFVGWVLTR